MAGLAGTLFDVGSTTAFSWYDMVTNGSWQFLKRNLVQTQGFEKQLECLANCL
jgi:hypothetical protein